MRRVPAECRATIDEVGNVEHNLQKLGKAGASRWRGIKPTVRGAAMNPVDHPHGGGEAKAGQGNPHPVRSEEHTSELQSLMRISYAVFCLQKTRIQPYHNHRTANT